MARGAIPAAALGELWQARESSTFNCSFHSSSEEEEEEED
jgi:hypothetical protein